MPPTVELRGCAMYTQCAGGLGLLSITDGGNGGACCDWPHPRCRSQTLTVAIGFVPGDNPLLDEFQLLAQCIDMLEEAQQSLACFGGNYRVISLCRR